MGKGAGQADRVGDQRLEVASISFPSSRSSVCKILRIRESPGEDSRGQSIEMKDGREKD